MRHFVLLSWVLFFLFTHPLWGQSIDPAGFFKGDTVISLQLSGHLKQIDDPEKYEVKRPGYARFVWPDGSVMDGAIEFAPRGKSRFAYCDPPPLMLYFKTNQTGPLSSLGKLKLVWACNSSDYYNQLLLREYLVYKMYNLVTPYSFRARLLNVTFSDSSRKGNAITRKGFLLEDVDDLAQREHCREYEDTMVMPEKTNLKQYALMAMFEYMIGNTDWSLMNYQNIKLITPDSTAVIKPIPVPYDFDYSGMVDAEYAVPHESIPIENVRQRYNKAMALPLDQINAAAAVLKDAQPGLLNLIDTMEGLAPAGRKYMRNYLNSFFEEMEDFETFSKVFLYGAGGKKPTR